MRSASTVILLLLFVASARAIVRLAPGHASLSACIASADQVRGPQQLPGTGPYIVRLARPWSVEAATVYPDTLLLVDGNGRAVDVLRVGLASWFANRGCTVDPFGSDALLLACIDSVTSTELKQLIAVGTSHSLGFIGVCALRAGNKHHSSMRGDAGRWPSVGGRFCFEAPLSHELPSAHRGRRHLESHLRDFAAGCEWHTGPHGGPPTVQCCFDTDAAARGAAMRMAEHHLVHYVATVHPARPLNKWVRGQLQTGIPAAEPFAASGLQGDGYIVGVADTGVDTDHCFFDDVDHALQFNQANPSHRKIFRYTSATSHGTQRNSDFLEGHGTHVVGTLVGSVTSAVAAASVTAANASRFHGVIPQARVSFTDLAANEESITLPTRVDHFIHVAHGDGARVHSNSWGVKHADYTSLAQQLDTYAVSTPDMLMLFAAGNDADVNCDDARASNVLCDRYTVMSPSTSKNGLSVGASMAVAESWVAAGHGNYLLRLDDPTVVPASTNGARPSWATAGTRAYRAEFGASTDIAGTLVLDPSSSREGCSVPDSSVVGGRVVLVLRGTCKFGVKAQNLAAAGAAGMVVVNNIEGDPIIMGQDKDHPFHVRIPGYMIGQADGRALMQLVSHTQTRVAATIRSDDSPDAHKDPENLSSFSSHGPTRDLRYKPDLVAVGEFVHSARSDALPGSHNCDLWPSMGTSMATPAVAGAAVLVREYFDRGFYPTGVATAANALSLRSDTLKAVLVHASMPLRGLFDRNSRGDWRRLGSVPSFEQGHGSLRLNSTLRLFHARSGSGENTPDLSSGPQLFVSQNLTVQTGERHVVCVAYRPSPSAGGDPTADPFRATLAWIDPAGNPSAHYQLVNDLDLHVEAPDGREFFGNRRVPGGVRATATDRLNNVERVIIRDAPAGTYRVTVNARHVPHGPQSFALATSGTAETPCTQLCDNSRCAAHGSCSTAGECTCHAGWRGTYCDVPVPSIGAETLFVGAVEPMEWEVISLHVPAAQVHVSMTLQSLSVDGDPNVYVGFNIHPQPFNRRYALALTQCDNCANHMGGPLPANHTLQFTSREKGTYYIAIAAMCCTRAPFQLYVKATEASKPSVHTISLGSTRTSDHDWSRRVLNVPTDVAVVLNISGSFDEEADASTAVRVGAFQSTADTVECILQQVAADIVMCLLPADSVNRLCSASSTNAVLSVAVTQAGTVFRTVGSRSTLTCYHVSQAEFRAPNGDTVHELAAEFAVPVSTDSICDGELLATPLPNATATIDCLQHRLAVLQSAADGPAPEDPKNQTLLLPFGAASRGGVVALAVQDATSVLPPVQSHWWPMSPAVASLAVSVVNPATNQWFDCDQVSAAPGGLFFRVAPPGSVPPTNTLLRVVIGVRHVNTTHFRWAQAPGLALKIQPAPDGLRLTSTRDPEFRGPLPRLPEAALRQPLTLFVLGQDVGPRHVGVVLSPTFAAAVRHASPTLQPVFGASSEVRAADYTFDADGAGIEVHFAANVFTCGVPMALHLQPNVSAALYGGVPDAPLAEATVSFHCPSKVVSVAAHVPHSYHAMPETAGSRIEVFGAFADYPTGAVLRDAATNVELALSVLHWSTSAISLTLPSAQRALLTYNTPLEVIVILPNGRNVSTVSPFAADGPVLPVIATFYSPNTTAAITGVATVSPQSGFPGSDASAVTLPTVVAETAFSPDHVRVNGLGLAAGWARSSPAASSDRRVLRFTNRSVAAAEFLHGRLTCETAAGVTSTAVTDEFHAPVTDVSPDGTTITVAVHPSAAGTCHISLHIAASRQPQPTYRLAPAADSLASDSVTVRRSPSEVGAAGSLRTPGAAIGAVLIAGRQTAVVLAVNPALSRIYPTLDARVYMAAGRHTWPGAHSVCASASSDAMLASSAWPAAQIGTAAGTIPIDGSTVLEHVARTAVASGWAADESSALVDMPVGLVGCISPTAPLTASLFPLPTPPVRVVVLRRLSVAAADELASLNAQELLGTDSGSSVPRLSFKGASAAATLTVNSPLAFGVEASTEPGMRFSAHAWIVQSTETSLETATTACRSTDGSTQSVPLGAAIAGEDGTLALGRIVTSASPLAAGAPALLCITVGVTTEQAGLPPASQASAVPVAQLVAVRCSDDDECGSGTCDRATQQCQCDARTRGPNCEFACPVRDSDSAVCHGRGECSATGTCNCFPGFAGPSCAAAVESLGVTYLKPVSGTEITLQLPALKDSPDAAAASWRLFQIVDGTDGPRGDKDLEVSLRVGALQRLIMNDGRAAPLNEPVWLDAYQWCLAADVGIAERAIRHYEAPPQGLLPGAAAQMSFVLGRAEFVNCSCHIATKTDPLAGDGAAVMSPRHFCLGLYLSSRSVVQEPVAHPTTVAEPLQAPVAVTVKHQDHEVIEPDIVVRACGTPCLTIRAALGIAFALLGILVAHLLTKRC